MKTTEKNTELITKYINDEFDELKIYRCSTHEYDETYRELDKFIALAYKSKLISFEDYQALARDLNKRLITALL